MFCPSGGLVHQVRGSFKVASVARKPRWEAKVFFCRPDARPLAWVSGVGGCVFLHPPSAWCVVGMHLVGRHLGPAL